MGLKIMTSSAVATRQLSSRLPASLVTGAISLTMIATLGGLLMLALSTAAIEFSSSSSLLSQISVLGTCVLPTLNTQAYWEEVLLHYYYLPWALK
jgi:hypothetical protein